MNKEKIEIHIKNIEKMSSACGLEAQSCAWNIANTVWDSIVNNKPLNHENLMRLSIFWKREEDRVRLLTETKDLLESLLEEESFE